jgi:serine-type D-Ala-D-Ala carboxypeptidase (penicillin-binding protein 5/6)
MKKLYKLKYLVTFFLLFSFVSVFHTQAVFAEFETAAGSAILMEASTGKMLYEKNADVSMPPASITKLMTLLLGFESIDEGRATWETLVPISEKAWRTEGSRMFAEVGSKVKYGDIITGISVVSANDGCVALAEYLKGSEEAFVRVMNQRAQELGMTQTQFKNSHGLPAERHYMSARDIAILARHLITTYPRILEIESMTEYTHNDITQPNRNPLLGVFPGADGLKTGWTEEAGFCLVGTAKKDDLRMISVVLNTKNEPERLAAAQEILSFGFNNFQFVDIKKKGDIVEEIAIKKGKVMSVPVKLDESITLLLPTARKADLKIVTSKDIESLTAPAQAGTPVGKLEVTLDDEVLASVSVSTSEEAVKAGFWELLFRGIGDFFRNLF